MSSSSSRHTLAEPDVSVVSFRDGGAEWDDFVSRSEGGTFCHLAGWREIMSDVLGHENLYSVAMNPVGEWIGVLPLVRVRSRLFGHYLVSMPFLSYGGPLGTEAAQAALAEHALAEARRSNVDLLELRTRHSVRSGLSVSTRKITVLLELSESEEVLWEDGFGTKLRNKIRRSMRDGKVTEFGLDRWEDFYRIFARHMRDLGTPVLPRRFFERIVDVLGHIVEIGVVYSKGEPVAAGWGFTWGDEFEMTWSAALREYKQSRPNMLLYWSFMQRLIGRGVRCFNFGRCTPGSGTHEFKRQWGGADVPLPWLQWSSQGLSATPTPERTVYSLGAAAWRRIPQPLADRLGPILARQIP